VNILSEFVWRILFLVGRFCSLPRFSHFQHNFPMFCQQVELVKKLFAALNLPLHMKRVDFDFKEIPEAVERLNARFLAEHNLCEIYFDVLLTEEDMEEGSFDCIFQELDS